MSEQFSELKKIAEAARDAGYTREERRQLIEHPQKLVSDDVSPKLAEKLSPKSIEAILLKLKGAEGADSPLIELGNVLYDFEKRLSAESDTFTEKEARLLGVGAQLFQRALFDGSLSDLHGANGAAAAFLVNRLTKLEQMKPRGNQASAVDMRSFDTLTEGVTRFFNDHYTEQALDQEILVQQAHERSLKEVLDQSEDPDVKLYLQQAVVSKELESETRDIEDNAQEHVRELAKRLKQSEDLFIKIYGNFGESTKALNDLENVIRTLNSIDPNKEPRLLGVLGARHEGGNLLDMVVRHMDDGFTESSPFTDSIEFLHYNLEQQIKKTEQEIARTTQMAKGGRTKGASLQDQVAVLQLGEKARKLEETKKVVSALSELTTYSPQGPGIWARRKRVSLQREAVRQQIELAKKNLRATDDQEIVEQIVAYEQTRSEQAYLASLKPNVELYRRWFEKSVGWLRGDVSRSSTEMMYFIKTALVASDKRRTVFMKHPEIATLGLPKPIENPIATHEFVEYDDKTRYGTQFWYGDGYDQPPKKFKYSDIHFKTDHLPFALIMTDYFRAQR